MKSLVIKHKILVLLLLISISVVVAYFVVMENFVNAMAVYTVVGLIKPLGASGLCLSVLLLYFFAFSEKIFKTWLKHIAWWYLLGLLLLVVNTPVFSGNIYHVDRSVLVLWGMGLLFVITVPYTMFLKKRLTTPSGQ